MIKQMYMQDYKLIEETPLLLRKPLVKDVNMMFDNFTAPLSYIETLNCLVQIRNPKCILDFGMGNSTRFFSTLDVELICIEDNLEYAEKIKEECSLDNSCVHICESEINNDYSCYKGLKLDGVFDFISIDGPYGYKSKLPRTNILDIIDEGKLDNEFCIVLHDSDRIGEKNLICEIRKHLDNVKIEYHEAKLAVNRGAWLFYNGSL